MIKKYRKKSVIIEAVQFTDEDKDSVLCWAMSINMGVYASWDPEGKPIIVIPTIGSRMFCEFGDYLIKELFLGSVKLHPCKPDIFEKTYEVIQ